MSSKIIYLIIVFFYFTYTDVSAYPQRYVYPGLKTTGLEYVGDSAPHKPIGLYDLLQD
jgi:hypothetical protein